VVEQVAKTDPASLSKTPGKELAHAVVEPQLAFGHEEHRNRCHEALRHASDPEAILWPRGPVADHRIARRDDVTVAVAFDEGDHARNLTRRDEAIRRLLQRDLGRRRPIAQRDGERGSDENHARDDDKGHEPHVTSTPRAWSPLRRYAPAARRV
jgi:hypothetical protein